MNLQGLVVSKAVHGAQTALARVDLKPLGRPLGGRNALSVVVLECFSFSAPSEPRVAGRAVELITVDWIRLSVGVWLRHESAAFACKLSKICVA